MEWLRNLSLRKAYLLFTVSCFLVAFLLTWGTTKVCVSLRESLAPSGVEIVYDESGKGTIVSREIPTEEAWAFQFILPFGLQNKIQVLLHNALGAGLQLLNGML